MSEIVRWGIIGCGNVTEVKSGPAFQKAARLGAGGRHAPRPEEGRRLRPEARRAALLRPRRGFDRRCRGGRGLRRDASLVPLSARAPGRRRRQSLPGREADGHDPCGVPADGRGVPRQGPAALRRVLPARAAALPPRARTAAGRESSGRSRPCTSCSTTCWPWASRRKAGGSTRKWRGPASSTTWPRTASTCWTSCSGRSPQRPATPRIPAAAIRPRT